MRSVWFLRPNPIHFASVNNLPLSRSSSSTADRGQEALSRVDKQRRRSSGSADHWADQDQLLKGWVEEKREKEATHKGRAKSHGDAHLSTIPLLRSSNLRKSVASFVAVCVRIPHWSRWLQGKKRKALFKSCSTSGSLKCTQNPLHAKGRTAGHNCAAKSEKCSRFQPLDSVKNLVARSHDGNPVK